MRYSALATNRLLMILIALDIAFLVIHYFWITGVVQGSMFKISKDGSYAEIFQYVKLVSAGSLLLWLAFQSRSTLLFFWSTISFYLCIDDAIQIHERFGGRVLGGGLKGIVEKSYHQGQALFGVIFFIIVGSILLVLWRNASPFAKNVSAGIILSIGILGFSSVGIDYLHAMLTPKGWNTVAVLLEEGGEHLGVSLLLWFSACAWVSRNEAR